MPRSDEAPPPPCPDPPLAYRDESFLDSEEARPLRMLAEYLQPMRTFELRHVQDTVVFFGSARLAADGPFGRYYHDARMLARMLTEWSIGLDPPGQRGLVCTGGGGGTGTTYSFTLPPTWAILTGSGAALLVAGFAFSLRRMPKIGGA